MADTVAKSEDDYVKIAIDLVSDPEGLARRRAAMRETVAASPLCDLDAFAEDFVSAIRIVTS